ncbi:MAG: dCTP deaminase, partial [Candidatus Omnitrophica bacterium]|nr:dCTP deaminase [Candidatus Omnitrophota bacterium]
MVKSDKWIKKMAQKGMIEPFYSEKIKKGISFGLSSYGYDFSLSEEFLIFKGNYASPKKISENDFEKFVGKICKIPPNSFVLGRSIEYFRIPRDVIGICFGKSTYARTGIVINVTPLEPEWEGYITIQIANLTPVEGEVYANEGIGQVIFLSCEDICERSYKDLSGKYNKAKNIE